MWINRNRMKFIKQNKLLLTIGTIATLIIVGFMAYGVYSFFTNYAFRTPIMFQSPIYRIKGNIEVIKLDDRKKLAVFDVGKIADQIYKWESSSGKNDACRNMGLYNGYGYRQNSSEFVCYESQEEVRNLVITWLTKHIKNGDIKSALCMYNQGRITSECSYALKFEL